VKESAAIKNSNKIIEILESIAQKFNDEHSKKVRPESLKKVFISAAKNKQSDLSNIKFCFAKVSSFLKLSSGNLESFKSFSFNKGRAASNFDFVDSDVVFAQSIIEEFGVDFDFSSIDELYLDTKPLSIIHKYL